MKKLILLIITLAACVMLSFTACAVTETDEDPRAPEAIVIKPTDLWSSPGEL